MASSVIISAPNAVLGIPRDVWGINSGVTEAADSTCSCTGWTFAHGDGVNKVFELPSLVSSLTTLYRRDWQGTVALSPNPRKNYLKNSETLAVAPNAVGSGTLVENRSAAPNGAMAMDGLTEDVGTSSHFVLYKLDSAAVIPDNTLVTPKVYIRPLGRTRVWVRCKNKASNETGCVVDCVGAGSVFSRDGGAIGSGGNGAIQYVGDGIYLVTLEERSIGSGGTIPFLVVYGYTTSLVYPGNGAPAFDTWGASIGSPGAYIKTAGAPVTLTDYAATGNTITLAEAPVLGSDLSVDADLVPHTCLSFNHGGRR